MKTRYLKVVKYKWFCHFCGRLNHSNFISSSENCKRCGNENKFYKKAR